ncbi:MAG TPA: NAD-dependent protein deacetylase [Rudaea sp.]|nr:NAD-dependent protein deacetylase [Rudaea sp.]
MSVQNLFALAEPANDSERDGAAELRAWLDAHRRVFVLTGAGISTPSGIPDYRGPDGLWKRRAPITYQAFVRDAAMRARYWARSFVGWPVVARAQPNRAHAALVTLEALGRTSVLVTQNVDGLHTRAGQRRVVDLHGRIDEVVCLDCTAHLPRADIQERLASDNPDWAHLTAATAPDGDADLNRAAYDDFRIPACPRCGGMLKPDVVFFGENVPRERVAGTQAALDDADAMLVVGSSLMVYSGYRFARAARERGMPLAILTRGVTRADAIATLKIDADCEAVLSSAVR